MTGEGDGLPVEHRPTISTSRRVSSWYCSCGLYAHVIGGSAVDASASWAEHFADFAVPVASSQEAGE